MHYDVLGWDLPNIPWVRLSLFTLSHHFCLCNSKHTIEKILKQVDEWIEHVMNLYNNIILHEIINADSIIRIIKIYR